MMAIERAMAAVRSGCDLELRRLAAGGLPAPSLSGQLIRPLLGWAGASGELTSPLWSALMAVQYAHEASLLHDDVIDAAAQRRGAATLAASEGVAAALVTGDHYLTTGYRLAAHTRSFEFCELYARAVERTVAGERLQHARRGRVLTRDEYEEIVLGKSGELIGCAFAAGAVLRGAPEAGSLFELGRRVGLCYQMLDDLLDYCGRAETGKTPYQDFQQRLWTWPLEFLPERTWPVDQATLVPMLQARDHTGRTPLDHALAEYERTLTDTLGQVRALLPRDLIVAQLFDGWLASARAAVRESCAAAVPVLPQTAALDAFFAQNSRSFSFAARFFPAAERARVADVYAFCRVTDDIVDGTADAAAAARTLDAWLELCRRAYDHGDSGVAALDRILHRAAAEGVPFTYVSELIAGMRMDLAPRRYESLAELRTYTYRVASVVGLWLTRAWGVHDPGVLQRAADLGHAMQLTNILRDVGEDYRAGRIYLPRDLMRRHRVDEALLAEIAAGAAPAARYRLLLEELMAIADTYYARAFHAMPALPRRARFAVAVAAEVYRGIQGAIRMAGHDNFRHRARTSTARKLVLAAVGLLRLARLSPQLRARAAHVTAAGLLVASLLLACHGSARAQQGTQGHLARVEEQIGHAPRDSLLRVERVRALYFVAVENEDYLERAFTALQGVRRDYPVMAEAHAPVLLAYEGALHLLKAKHGFLPTSRWRDARTGLRVLDQAVARAPEHPEVRYLRLISCYYLPGIFGRKDVVRQDFNALAELLPRVGSAYPRDFVRNVARFVLTHAALESAARERLREWGAHGT